jgi:hypothetical protein
VVLSRESVEKQRWRKVMKHASAFVALTAIAIVLGCGSHKKEGDTAADPDVSDPVPDGVDTVLDVPEDSTDDTGDAVDAGPDAPPGVRPVDILVVVDDSFSMSEEQSLLMAGFPTLVGGILDPSAGETPVEDLHIGVVGTDMGTGGYTVSTCSDPVDGDDGVLRHEPGSSVTGCDATYPTFLGYASATPDSTAIDWIVKGFECIATLGIDGCSFEQPLESSRKALVDHADGPNAGFLREDSILVILYLSDENDCSVDPENPGFFDPADDSLGPLGTRCAFHADLLVAVSTYVTALGALRATPGDLILGFIVGVPQDAACEGTGDAIAACLDHTDMVEVVDTTDPNRLRAVCASSASGSATPGRRFVELAQAFGARAHVESICDASFTPTMSWIVDRIQDLID